MPALDHSGQRDVGLPQHTRDVDVDLGLQRRQRGVEELRAHLCPGVADQQVHRRCRGQPALDGGAPAGSAEVGREALDGDAVPRAQVVRDRGESFLAARDEDEVVTVGGQLVREGRADPGGTACDEGDWHPDR